MINYFRISNHKYRLVWLVTGLILALNQPAVYAVNSIRHEKPSKDTFILFASDTFGFFHLNTIPHDTNLLKEYPIYKDTLSIGKLKKYNLRKEFMNMILVSPNLDTSKISPLHAPDNNNFHLYNNKVIRNIDIKQLEIFGTSITDTAIKATKFSDKLANGLHINTQKQIVRNQLIFYPGERLEPLILADNERILRDLPNIQDSRILLHQPYYDSDTIDVTIVSKDVWPIGIGIDMLDLNFVKAGVWNKNILGLGHEFIYQLTWRADKIPEYGHKVGYKINNIRHSFVSLETNYETQWNIEAYRFYLNRDFFAPNTRYAGGIGYETVESLRDILISDTVFSNHPISYNYYDAWFGHAKQLTPKKNLLIRRNIAISGRILKYEYSQRPEVESTLLYEFHQRTTFLGSLGISRQGFRKTRLVYGFGKLEDIPYGLTFTATLGYEINEFSSRPYFGLRHARGIYYDKLGYLYFKTEFSTFINNKFEQAAFGIEAKYHSFLINSQGSFKYRIFVSGKYKTGFNRFEDEFLQLSNNNGIRGLNSELLRGNQEIYANLETDCYSPHKLFGFGFTYFTFIDAGMITYKNNYLVKNPVYSSFGIGVRVRNENLVFNTIVIRLSYYPILPPGANPNYINFNGTSAIRPESFQITKPEVFRY